MKQALIVIDFVNDFVDDKGSLTCGAPAQKIDGNIAKIVKDYADKGEFIVIANDAHKADDKYSPESGFFPAHCIKGTWGAEVYGKTLKALEKVSEKQKLTVEKQRYSAFCGTNLDLKLRERKVDTVCLTGVCTDICVLHAAIDAYNLGYKVRVLESAVASFDGEAHKFALKHMKNVLGAEVV